MTKHNYKLIAINFGFGIFCAISIFCQSLPYLIRNFKFSAPCTMDWMLCSNYSVNLSYFVLGSFGFIVSLLFTLIYYIIGPKLSMAWNSCILIVPLFINAVAGEQFSHVKGFNVYYLSVLSILMSLICCLLFKRESNRSFQVGGLVFALGICLIYPTRGITEIKLGPQGYSASLRSGLAGQAEGNLRVISVIGNIEDTNCKESCRRSAIALGEGGYFSFHGLGKLSNIVEDNRALLLGRIHFATDRNKIILVIDADSSAIEKMMSELPSHERLQLKLDYIRNKSLASRFHLPLKGGEYLCEPFEDCKLESSF